MLFFRKGREPEYSARFCLSARQALPRRRAAICWQIAPVIGRNEKQRRVPLALPVPFLERGHFAVPLAPPLSRQRCTVSANSIVFGSSCSAP